MAKTRFVFGKDMTDEKILDAIKKMGKEHGFNFVDSRKRKRTKKLNGVKPRT